MFRLASRPPSSPRCRRGYEASSFAGPPWMRRCGQSSAKQGSGRRRHLAGGGSPTCPPDAAGERPRTMRRALSRGHRYRGGPRVRPRRGSLRQGCPLRRGSPGQARSPEPLPWRAYRGATRQTAPRDSASGSWPARRDSGPPSCTTSLAGSGSSSHRIILLGLVPFKRRAASRFRRAATRARLAAACAALPFRSRALAAVPPHLGPFPPPLPPPPPCAPPSASRPQRRRSIIKRPLIIVSARRPFAMVREACPGLHWRVCYQS